MRVISPRPRWSGAERRCYATAMRTSLVFTCLVLLAAAAGATEVYRWVDENGVIHYSDSPHPGAEKIEVAEPPVMPGYRRSPAATSRSRPSAAERTQPAGFTYQSLTITQPAAEETLWNIAGRMTVTLSLQPALRQGDRVRVYFDGAPREVPGSSFELDEVWRGAHNLQAEVVNEAGEVMIRSEPVRFYVQQTTVNSRNNPNNPRNRN